MTTNPPEHRSYSQLSTFQSCPHKYYLSKIVQLPERPAVYTAAGTAIHSAIEKINEFFYEQQGNRSEEN